MCLKEVRRPAKLLRYRLLAFFAVFGPGFICQHRKTNDDQTEFDRHERDIVGGGDHTRI